MKLFFFFAFILPAAFAQDYSEILYYQGRSLGNTPKAQIEETKKILAQVQVVTQAQGTLTRIETHKDKAGNAYPVMVILPGSGSKLNQEASAVAKNMGNLPLVFSPYDLGRSRSNAFFDPAGSKLGVSYGFILGDENNSSYLHELYHASTYQKVLTGSQALWAGVMRVTKGEYLSSSNRDYYSRFASLDELPATALSLKLDTNKLLELKRSLTPQEFNKSRGEAYNLLSEIYLSAHAGYYLARQVKDLAQRALHQQATIGPSPLQLGNFKKNLPTSIFVLDAYSWEIVGGRGSSVAIKDGAEFKLNWVNAPTQSLIQQRLEEIIQRSSAAEAAFKQTEKCIYVLIEYPDVARTNYRCLEEQAGKPFLLVAPEDSQAP